jgi:hypothetical protein
MRHDHGERWGPRDLIRRVQNAFDVAGRAVDAAVRYRLQVTPTRCGCQSQVDEALGCPAAGDDQGRCRSGHALEVCRTPETR